MSNLPKYYFRDIPAEIMREIMDEMLAPNPEPELAELDRDIQEVKRWLLCQLR